LNLKSFDWKSLQKYFSSQSADDLNRFLEKMPQNAGQTILIAAGIAWAMAGALGLYTAIQTQQLTELRAKLMATEALKPSVPKIKNIAIPKAEVEKFVGQGWRVSLENLCVGRECDKRHKLAVSLKVNKVSVEKPS